MQSIKRTNTQMTGQPLSFPGRIRPALLMITVAMLAWTCVVRAHAGQWIHNVSGGGQDLYPDSTTPTFNISFSAKEDAAGNIVGQVLWTYPDGTLISTGTVDSLYVIGNQAFVKYLVTAGDPIGGLGGYGTVGNYVFVGFEDNGEGANATPDRQTYIYYGTPNFVNYTAEDFANFVIPHGGGWAVEWVHGNIQVR
jgi:hypothetical protein